MSETGGIVVIPKLNDFEEFDFLNIRNNNGIFVEKIFEVGGFNKKALLNGRYIIETVDIIGNYLKLETFGDEWVPLANSAMRADRYLELYGMFYSEYGTRMYFARNKLGEAFNYSYEDDGGDESEQDFFDIEQFEKELSEKENHYLSIIPEELKASCNEILPVKPMFLFDEDEDDYYN